MEVSPTELRTAAKACREAAEALTGLESGDAVAATEAAVPGGDAGTAAARLREHWGTYDQNWAKNMGGRADALDAAARMVERDEDEISVSFGKGVPMPGER